MKQKKTLSYLLRKRLKLTLGQLLKMKLVQVRGRGYLLYSLYREQYRETIDQQTTHRKREGRVSTLLPLWTDDRPAHHNKQHTQKETHR